MPDAVEMRVANTAEALGQADWQPYAAESRWHVPTGSAARTVYIEFRDSEGAVTSLSIEVPPYDEALGHDYGNDLPIATAMQHEGLGGPVWQQDFARDFDAWASDLGPDGTSPASWSAEGGVADDGHIWTDDSRWTSQDLAGGPVVVALTERVHWIAPLHQTMDFSGLTARFQLAGDALDLNGGAAYFWIEDAQGLWRSTEALDVGDGVWTDNEVALGTGGSWESLSGLPPEAQPDFAAVGGWGIAFAGYAPGEEPTGLLRLDDFSVGANPSDLPVVANLDQSLAFAEGDAAVALQPISIAPPEDGAEVTVSLRLSDPAAGRIEGAGLGVAGLYTVTGSAAEVNAILAALSFVPDAERDLPVEIAVTVRAGLLSSPSATGTIELTPEPAADGPLVLHLDQAIAFSTSQAVIALGAIRVADPDHDAMIEVVLTLPPGAGALYGRVTATAEGYRITGSVAEVNAALATLAFLPAPGTIGPVEIAIAVSDGTGAPDATGAIMLVGRANATPDAIDLAGPPLSVGENSARGTLVGTVTGLDPDGDALSYRLVDDAGGRFQIDALGRITVLDPSLVDFETGALATITVRATDLFGASFERDFDVQILDVAGEVVIGDVRNDVLRGGIGDDQLWSYIGFDTLIGSVGSDTYIVLAPETVILENAGEGTDDSVATAVSYTLTPGAEVEVLGTLDAAGTAPINLGGNEFANAIYGNAGANRIDGGGGNDTLRGDAGADVFLFSTTLNAATNVDSILDFVSGEDRIRLDDRIFAGLAAGLLDANRLQIGAAATTADHRLIYDPASGLLSFDPDGSGGTGATAFARLAVNQLLSASDIEISHALVPADLSPGQLIVEGVPGYAHDGFGGVLVHLLANIPDAVEMRFGNTEAELAMADWRPYAAASDWAVRSGPGGQDVFAEFRLANGSIRATSALVPAFDPATGTDFPLPHSDAIQIGSADGLVWQQSFSDGTDRWTSYDYDGGSFGVGNIFHPVSWTPEGGADGGGFVWADDSRWRIDTPEDPHSILALLTYPRWISSTTAFGVDLADTIVEFHLRGDGLDLHGATAYFWIVDSTGRWKNYAQPLVVGDGEWAFNSITLSTSQLDQWNESFDYDVGATVNLHGVHSWGISFVGFDQGAEPTGVLALDEFVISRQAEIRLEHAEQTLLYDAFDGVAIAPLLVSGPTASALVEVTLTLSDPAIGSLEGAGAGVEGVYTISGTLAEVNAALAALHFRPLTNAYLTSTIAVGVTSGASTAPAVPGHLLLIRGNEAPAGMPDALTGTEDEPLTVSAAALLGNDEDGDGDALSLTGVGNAVGGSVTLDGGNILFTPNADFNGTARFGYSIGDGHGGVGTATVTIEIAPVNDAPVAIADALAGAEDQALTIAAATLLANDLNVDGDTLSVTSVANAVGGSVTLDGGNILFTPNANFHGTARFDYSIGDGHGGVSSANVTIEFAPVNDAPVGTADALAGAEDQPLAIAAAALLGNDQDIDGDVLNVTGVANAVGGSVTLDGGIILFTPNANFHGTARFDYSIADGHGGVATATVTIEIAPVNDAPVGMADALTGTEDQGLTIAAATLLGNDQDVDGDTLSLTGVFNATGGSVTLDGGNILFTPNANFTGTARFDYSIADGHGGVGIATATIQIAPVNDAPVGTADTLTGTEDQVLTVAAATLLGNDQDIDGDTLSISGVSDAVGGSVILSGGNVLFTPTANFNGTASFNYSISDGHGGVGSATVTITVAPVNDAPVGTADALTGTEDQPLTIPAATLLGNDQDIDGDTLSLTGVSNAVGGSVTLIGGNVLFTPNANFNGTARFDYGIADGHGGTAVATATIQLAPVNDAPVARNDAFSTDETAAIGNGLNLFNDNGQGTDADIDSPLSIASVGGAPGAVGTQIQLASGALLVVNADGSFSYNPNGAFNHLTPSGGGSSNAMATDSFSYALAGGGTGTVTITIAGVRSPGDEILGTAAVDAIVGTPFADAIRGLAGNDVMNGGLGNDSYYVDAPGDQVVEAGNGGNDRVYASVDYTLYAGQWVEVLSTDNDAGTAPIALGGNELNNIIYGNAGDNLLYGKGGDDWLEGLDGNDLYYVDSAGDRVVEAAGGGNDRIVASADYTLYAGQQIETLSTDNDAGTAAIALGGNELANVIYGNAGANILYGKGGDDWLEGRGGNDSYYVDSAGDRVVEAAGGGNDRIFAASDYTLYAGQEVEVLSTDWDAGTAAIALGGNEFNNIIYGNAGDNILYGKGGNDYLDGRGGNDFYYVDSAGDQVVEAAGGGNDRIHAAGDYTLYAGQHVEILSTDNNAGTAAIILGGNELANTIYGNNGNNILYGKGGNDTLLGGGGSDQFWFNTALGATNVDTIYDFVSGTDKIVLFRSVFAGLPPNGLHAPAFRIGTAAGDPDDRIIYDSATGALLFDADGHGPGGAIHFATLNGAPLINVNDFMVI